VEGKTEPAPRPQPIDTVAPPRNFTLLLEERLRAYAQGVPGYMRRRRRIEDLEAKLIEKLAPRLSRAPAELDIADGRIFPKTSPDQGTSVRELLARVKAILRRTEGKAKRLARYQFADLDLDFEAYKATKAAQPLDLSPREFELLRYLIERKGETVTRDQLLEDVWGYESYPSTRTVDTHIAKLRAKIGDSGSEPRWILTIHGMGYKFAG